MQSAHLVYACVCVLGAINRMFHITPSGVLQKRFMHINMKRVATLDMLGDKALALYGPGGVLHHHFMFQVLRFCPKLNDASGVEDELLKLTEISAFATGAMTAIFSNAQLVVQATECEENKCGGFELLCRSLHSACTPLHTLNNFVVSNEENIMLPENCGKCSIFLSIKRSLPAFFTPRLSLLCFRSHPLFCACLRMYLCAVHVCKESFKQLCISWLASCLHLNNEHHKGFFTNNKEPEGYSSIYGGTAAWDFLCVSQLPLVLTQAAFPYTQNGVNAAVQELVHAAIFAAKTTDKKNDKGAAAMANFLEYLCAQLTKCFPKAGFDKFTF